MTAWDDYSSFWVLGDSLSDTGNVAAATGGAIPGPDYYENRFSNGPIWADYFLDRFIAAGKPAASIAFGGATAATNGDLIPDIGAQSLILRAQSAGLLGLRPLVAIWAGGNDIGAAVDNVVGTAISLLDITQDFVIFNMPDVGATPRFQNAGAGPAAEATAATDAYNAAIGPGVDLVRAAGGTVTLVDVTQLDLASIGITNTTTPCLIGTTLLCDDAQAAASQYWDGFHPTGPVHRLAGELALAQFGAVPVPASLPLMLSGLVVLGALRRRVKR